MIRVLQGFVANQYGGISMYAYRNYLYLDHKEYQYDFLYTGELPTFASECINKGARFYKVERMRNIFKYIESLRNVIKKHDYDIVYFNFSFANILPVLIAKSAGAKKIFLHAHATGIESNSRFKRNILWLYHKVSLFWISFIKIDHFFACSDAAGKFIFGNSIIHNSNYTVMNNAIDLNQYKYTKQRANEIRTMLNIDDNDFVLGHIGRFAYAKNHEFLIQVFYELSKIHKKVKLLLVGKGDLENNIKELVKKLGIDDKVIFIGTSNDVASLMQAMDSFILPSRFEGLGMVGIEAQAAGLPCFVSSVCPPELKVTDLVKFISLDKPAKEWAEIIICGNKVLRKDRSKEITSAGYNIEKEIKKIEAFYMPKGLSDEKEY